MGPFNLRAAVQGYYGDTIRVTMGGVAMRDLEVWASGLGFIV